MSNVHYRETQHYANNNYHAPTQTKLEITSGTMPKNFSLVHSFQVGNKTITVPSDIVDVASHHQSDVKIDSNVNTKAVKNLKKIFKPLTKSKSQVKEEVTSAPIVGTSQAKEEVVNPPHVGDYSNGNTQAVYGQATPGYGYGGGPSDQSILYPNGYFYMYGAGNTKVLGQNIPYQSSDGDKKGHFDSSYFIPSSWNTDLRYNDGQHYNNTSVAG